MTRRFDVWREKGVALIHMAVTLTVMILFAGLAADTGRAYVVKAQLSKAVDGAALGAARNLNSGDPRGEAGRVFNANFPAGFMGTTSVTDPATDPSFYTLSTITASGINVITVQATAVMPTTFMKLGGQNSVTVSSSGEATRRMVDLSLVLDVSSSIGWRWPYVRDAAREFVNSFDAANDRLSLIFFGTGAQIIDAMPSTRGFNKTQLMTDIPNTLPGGSTAMVQGLFRGWDQLRTVPNGQQSSLRVLVLFTDGASNSVPGIYNPGAPGLSRGLRTWDFPKNFPDPDNQTWNNPQVDGLYDTTTYNGGASLPAWRPASYNDPNAFPSAPWLPLTAFISNAASSGMPNNFPLSSATLTVNGMAQNARRPFTGVQHADGRWPSKILNINSAARNLVEIISNEARNDATGDYPIRIYTIGMGELVTYMLGPVPEQSADILMRMANDPLSQDHNSAQLDGKFYYAQTPADVGPAFAQLQNQIIRLTK